MALAAERGHGTDGRNPALAENRQAVRRQGSAKLANAKARHSIVARLQRHGKAERRLAWALQRVAQAPVLHIEVSQGRCYELLRQGLKKSSEGTAQIGWATVKRSKVTPGKNEGAGTRKARMRATIFICTLIVSSIFRTAILTELGFGVIALMLLLMLLDLIEITGKIENEKLKHAHQTDTE